MSFRSHALIYTLALALALACGLSSAFAVQFAVTASPTRVFLIKYDNGTATNYTIADLSSSSLKGVGAWKEYVFIADAASAGDTTPRSLRVGRVIDAASTTPNISWVGTVLLQSGGQLLKSPETVTVDAAGNVYVVSATGYAYITSTNGWADTDAAHVAVSVVSFTGMTPIDIALTGTGNSAVLALRDNEPIDGLPIACSVAGSASTLGGTIEDTGYFPKGIAAGKGGYSYIVNNSTELVAGGGPWDAGCISVVNGLAPSGDAFRLGEFLPRDVAFFSTDAVDYLGVVGVTPAGVSQAWRLPLDPLTSIPTLTGSTQINIDTSADHRCALSLDGTLFFATSPQTKSAVVFDTSTWTKHPIPGLGTPAKYICAIAPVMGSATGPAPLLADMPTQLYFVGRPFVGPAPVFLRGKEGSTFTLESGPNMMAIDTATGVVTWPIPVRDGSPSKPYTVTIKATNDGGSDSVSFTLSQFPKQAENSDEVATGEMVVTAAFQDSFWIESPNRLWGMLVAKLSHGLSVNRKVEVRGTIHTTNDGLRYIHATSVTGGTQSLVLAPIYMPMRSLAGGDFLRSFGPTSGQIGATGSSGANNVGLYVKVSGTVLSIAEDHTSFVLDGGSGVTTKVAAYYPVDFLNVGDNVAVTGISSLQSDGDTYQRLIMARDGYFLQVIEP